MLRRTGWIIGVLGCLAPAALAIIPNNGLDSAFPFVGRNAGVGSLVAVGPRAVITARHITLDSLITFSADASAPFYAVDLTTATDIGNSDLRMYRTLQDLPAWAPIDFTPLPVNFTHTVNAGGGLDFSQNATGSFAPLTGVGFGLTGQVNAGGTGYDVNATSPMHRRAAPFFSDSRGNVTVGSATNFSSIISFLINNGDGTVETGDSGGGMFRNVGGQWRLVGIHSFNGGNRLFGSGFGADRRISGSASLNFISGFAELAPHQAQIEAYLVPEPASFAIIGLGIAALLRRRKK